MLQAECDGDFQLHLHATTEALPWFWVAGRIHYQKYVSIYIADMKIS